MPNFTAPNLSTKALSEADKLETSVGRLKVEREEGFPYSVLEKGHRVNVFKAKATMEIDRTRILNAICEVDAARLDEELAALDAALASDVKKTIAKLDVKKRRVEADITAARRAVHERGGVKSMLLELARNM